MTSNQFWRALFCLALLLTFAGCKGPGKEAGPSGSAKANTAYLSQFGQPPTPQQGTCFARVGYFPLAGEPGRVARS